MNVDGMQHEGAGWTLTRGILLSCRRLALRPDRSTRQHIDSLGCACYNRGCRAGRQKTKDKQARGIPVVVGRRQIVLHTPAAKPRQRTLIVVKTQPTLLSAAVKPDEMTPSLYVLNAAALSKPGAIGHLAVDLQSYGVSVAIVTETHFKAKHTDGIISVDGYTVFRQDVEEAVWQYM